MTGIVSGFDWDEGNCERCRKPGVSIEEVEAALRSGQIMQSADPHPGETRFRAVGITAAGRSLFIVYTLRTRDEKTYLRPISARYMHRKEMESCEKEAVARLPNG